MTQAFASVEFNKTAKEMEGEIANEYKNKLCLNGKALPDPFVLKTGWKNKENKAFLFGQWLQTFTPLNT